MKSSFTFGKDERLCRERDIKELFHKGSSFYLYPFKVLFLTSSEDKHQILLSVSKRNFKRAVDRNLIKRRMREGYRLHKGILPQQPALQFALIYTSKEIMTSERIHQAIVKILSRLAISV